MPAPNLVSGGVLVRRNGCPTACRWPAGETKLCSWLPHLFPLGLGASHIILLLHGTPAFLSQTRIRPSPLFSWGLSRRAPDSQGSMHPTSGAQRSKFMQAPSFCRSLMTSPPDTSVVLATYGTCQQSPCLKLMLGSSAQARHLSRSHRCCLGEQTLPIASPLGFPSVSRLFPWIPLLPVLPLHGQCVLCNLLRAPRQLPSISSLLMAASCCKAASGLGLQPSPGHPFSLPLSTEAVVALLAFSCRQFISSCSTPPSSASALC